MTRITFLAAIGWAATFLPSVASAESNPPYYRLHQVKIIDQHGFERPLTAMTMLLPTDWTFQSNIAFALGGCSGDLVQTTFRASSPDGRIVIEMFPVYYWQWSTDPGMQRAMQMSNQTNRNFGRKPCDIAAPMPAADFLRRVEVPKLRPGKPIAAIEGLPDTSAALAAEIPRAEAQAQRLGLHLRIQGDAARARLNYSLNGEPVEEWITALTLARAQPVLQSVSYSNEALKIFALRAPQGQLAGMEHFFKLLLSTLRVDPEWQARVTQVLINIQAGESKAAMDRSKIIAQAGQEQNRIITQGFSERQRIQDQTAREFDQTIRGVATYRNPNTGETVELSNLYNHAWSNPLGEYILSDNPNFNPNITLGRGWTELQPAK